MSNFEQVKQRVDEQEQKRLTKTGNYADPTPEMLADPMWNAIWEEIKHWDINVPSEYAGYTGATGNHVTAIFTAVTREQAKYLSFRQFMDAARPHSSSDKVLLMALARLTTLPPYTDKTPDEVYAMLVDQAQGIIDKPAADVTAGG